MAISIKDDTYYTEQGKTAVKTARDTALKDNITLYTGQTDTTNKTYDAQVDVTGKAYDQSYRENAVQKAINERQVAESMANLGLTNSGLNRTQQTAIQLSYANNKAGIDKQKQSKIDALELARTQDLAKIEQNKLSSEAQINQYYDGLAQQYASEYKNADIDAYNKWVEEETKRLEAEAKAKTEQQKNYYSYLAKSNANNEKDSKYKVRTAGGSGKDDNGNEVYYFYDENGTKRTYPKGINPYTGKPITGGYTVKEIEEFGVWNGYQPKGVKYNGRNYGKVKKYVSDNGTAQIEHQGHLKTIWQTADGNLWVWDDIVGNYVQAWDKGNGNFEYEIY